MTDAEIIKALECLTGEPKLCKDCPYNNTERYPFCRENCAKDALDLINRQKAEIEKHKKLDELGDKTIENQNLVISQLRSDASILTDANENLQRLYREEKAKVERAKQKTTNIALQLQTAKTEIERLKKLLDEEEKQYRLCAKRFYKEGVKDLAKRLKDYYATKKHYDRPNAHTLISFLFALIDDLIEELAGDTE